MATPDPNSGPLLELLRPYLDRLQARLPKADFRAEASLIVGRDARDGPAGKSYYGPPEAPRKVSNEVTINDIAVQVAVPDAEAMADLLGVMADDISARIALGRYRDGLSGEGASSAPFRMMSQGRMSKAGAEDARAWFHRDGLMSCAPKLAGLMLPSAWLLLDRDVDEWTPPSAAEMTTDEWLAALRAALPGLDRADIVTGGSMSSRVRLKDGSAPFNSVGVHAFVLAAKAADILDLKRRVVGALGVAGHVWEGKPPEEGAKGPQRTLVDAAVIGDVGRLCYEGAPEVIRVYFDVLPREITIHRGAGRGDRRWVTSEVKGRSGSSSGPRRASGGGGGGIAGPMAQAGHDRLTSDVPVTIAGGDGEITMTASDMELLLTRASDDWRVGGPEEYRYRGQAPFRDSSSWAAIVRLDKWGRLMIHDTGAGVTYRAAFLPASVAAWVKYAAAEKTTEGRRRMAGGAMRALAWHGAPADEVARLADRLAGWMTRGDTTTERFELMNDYRLGIAAVGRRNRIRERTKNEQKKETENV